MPDEEPSSAHDSVDDRDLSATDVARIIDEARPEPRGRITSWAWGLISASLGVVSFVMLASGASESLPSGLLSAIAAITTILILRLRAQGGEAAAALMLHRVGRRETGPLMESLQAPDGRTRAVARWRLVQLLRRLTNEDCARVSAVQKACLFDSLTPWQAQTSPEFTLAALAVLPLFGDEAAVTAATRLARMKVWTRRQSRARQAARAVLPAVEQSVARRRLVQSTATAAFEPGAASAARTPASAASVSELAAGSPLMRFGFLVACWAVILPYGLVRALSLFHEGRWLLATPYAALAVVASQMHRLTLLSRHARLAREILREDDIAATGRLAEAVAWPDQRIRTAAIGALTRLLPRLKESDARLLTTAQRRCLYATLNRSNALAHPEYTLALLTALEQVGDLAAIPFVEELATTAGGSARLQAVADAARACLPALRERAKGNTDQQVLLRPAMPPADPSHMLLRPVSAARASNPTTLVRVPDPPET